MDTFSAWFTVFVIMIIFAAIPAAIAFTAVRLTLAEQEEATYLARTQHPSAGETGAYTPNHIPLKTRIWHTVASIALLVYGSIGLYLDDLYLPGKSGNGLHLHGNAALVMYGAMLCAALNLSSVVLDHYDKRDNEGDYREFAKWTSAAGFSLFAAALAIMFFSMQTSPRV